MDLAIPISSLKADGIVHRLHPARNLFSLFSDVVCLRAGAVYKAVRSFCL
jgi:hypothetical protein